MSKARDLADLGNAYSDGALSNRNLIINGGMAIDQRNGGASANYTSGHTFYLDRFSAEAQSLSGLVATVQQVSDAPSGFNHSMKTTVTTPASSGLSSSMIGADQRIEGYNISALGFGGSSAESFTLSFWVKSSETGTYCVSFFNGSMDRNYLATYTVNSANTWEYKTITVAGDTSGTWNTTNGIGLGVQFPIGGGPFAEGTAGAWSSAYRTRVFGAVSLNEIPNNPTWQITGVQLEVGDTATPFEHRSYGDELQRCQRFYQSILDVGNVANSASVGALTTGQLELVVSFRQEMRSTPTVVFFDEAGNSGVGSRLSPNVSWNNNSTAIGSRLTSKGFHAYSSSGSSGGTLALGYTADAEL